MRAFTGGAMLVAVAAMYTFGHPSTVAFCFLVFVSCIAAVLIVDDL